ncbi:unnamed protein product [Heligmosomoides polygyrus]|uniref:snRNA-activating protein complex subunit 3 n=1 Tax=Heligmosomoides polygyrus TaxID=6339 RepID=A0A3P7YR94_HELPZ|nr:unnamed protein product [Heligmosomoides polygyrus]
MAMDAVFDFENQEYVSEVVEFRKFFDDAMRSRRYTSDFGIRVGDEAYWKNDFISSIQHPRIVSEVELRTSKRLVDTLSLLMENEKKRNPQYKSIVLRSMRYDRFDTSVISHSVRREKLQASSELKLDEESNNSHSSNSGADIMERDGMIKEEVDESESPASGAGAINGLVPPSGVQSASTAKSLPFYNPYEDQCPVPVIDTSSLPTDSVSRVYKNKCELYIEDLLNVLKPEPHFGDEAPQMAASSSVFCEERFSTPTNYLQPMVGTAPFTQTEPCPPAPIIIQCSTQSIYSQMSVVECQSEVVQYYPVQPNYMVTKQENDIVAQVSVHVGYPRPLEKQEVRLGRLLKVLDRFLILGSNTLKDLKDAIDCPADYLVFADVSERPVTDDDLCKNRYPSSFFFFHDTFYIDMEPDGAQDITSEVRAWANERCLGETKVAYMSESRDKCHPTGPYPIPIFERNSRRIVCAGCKELTAEWVVWDHESTPSPVQYFCDPCYKDFNYDIKGRKTFDFKAAPLYDRHSRRTDITERTNSREDTREVDEQND